MGAVEPAVMVIDDDDHLREAVSLLLEAHGYDVHGCAGAQEALERLHQGATPDVIVLDLMMPRMDGWEFRIKQKREARWANIPVVALSADVSPKARAIDAQVYLSKPVDDQVLLNTVEQLVHALAAVRLREQIMEAEPSVGLPGVIAHEINNPLSFVIGNLELAQRKANELGPHLAREALASLVELRRVLARGQRGAERVRAVMDTLSEFELGREAPARKSNVPPEPVARVTRKRPSLLVIDDEPMMCELLGALLASDYEVVAFTDPRAALLAIDDRNFDVVLCDLMMPDLTGMDVYEHVAREHPELSQRFVFISGGAFTDRARDFLANTRCPQVRKPFHRQELVDAVEAQLTPRH